MSSATARTPDHATRSPGRWRDAFSACAVAAATVVGWVAASPLRWLQRSPQSTIAHPEWHACCESSNLLSWPRVALALTLPAAAAGACGWWGSRLGAAPIGAMVGVVVVWLAIDAWLIDGVIPESSIGQTYAKVLAAAWPAACFAAAALGRRMRDRRDRSARAD